MLQKKRTGIFPTLLPEPETDRLPKRVEDG